MSRNLIDRDALRQSIDADCAASNMPKMWYAGIAFAINHIIHAPTIDVEANIRLLDLNMERCEELRKQLRDAHENYEKHIAELEAQLPSAQPEPQWIPCSERLPGKVGSYLVYAPTYTGGSSSAKECKAGVMFARWLKGGHWSIEVGYYKRPGCVTHWMPLPDPPKGEQK